MKRLVFACAALLACACTPLAPAALGPPPSGFAGPQIAGDRFVTFDGTRLGLTRWTPSDGEPWAVIVALHGMNDYANAFHMAAPWWAQHGVATYAYDQRGFGRSPDRGVWFGHDVMAEDLRTFVRLVRQRHPDAQVVVLGESMGGAVAIHAFASDRPPQADRLVLLAPAVWGWSNQPLPYKTALWFAARFTGAHVYEPPSFVTSRVKASDNIDELIAMGRDPLMIRGARSDALYGLVALMEDAWRETGGIEVPVFYLYGANDEIIPERPSKQAAGRLKPSDRSAYYETGWHLLTRDKEGPRVWADVLAWLHDVDEPLPSGAPRIPGAPTREVTPATPTDGVETGGRGA